MDPPETDRVTDRRESMVDNKTQPRPSRTVEEATGRRDVGTHKSKGDSGLGTVTKIETETLHRQGGIRSDGEETRGESEGWYRR